MASRRGGTIGKASEAKLPEGLHYVAYWPGDDPSLRHLLNKVEDVVEAAVSEASDDAGRASNGRSSIIMHRIGQMSPQAPPLATVVTLTTEIPFLIEEDVYIRETASGGALHEDILTRLKRVVGADVTTTHAVFRRLLRPIYSSIASTEMVLHAGEQVPLFVIILQKGDAAAELPMGHRLPRATLCSLPVRLVGDIYEADDAAIIELQDRVRRFVATAHLTRTAPPEPGDLVPGPVSALLEAELDQLPGGDGVAYEQIVERVFRHCFPTFALDPQVVTSRSRMDLLLHVPPEANAFFWVKMRARHDLTQLVIECKNYEGKLPVAQAIEANEKYIVPAASKNLGLLITRWGVDKSCQAFLDQKWREGRCLLPLEETDLRAMLRYRDNGRDPSEWLWRAYTRFTTRLSNW